MSTFLCHYTTRREGLVQIRGACRAGSVFGFTGEKQDAETGVLHLLARQYDPISGRFLSADTVQPNAEGTQGYNRYGCVVSNPSTWTDASRDSVHVAV